MFTDILCTLLDTVNVKFEIIDSLNMVLADTGRAVRRRVMATQLVVAYSIYQCENNVRHLAATRVVDLSDGLTTPEQHTY